MSKTLPNFLILLLADNREAGRAQLHEQLALYRSGAKCDRTLLYEGMKNAPALMCLIETADARAHQIVTQQPPNSAWKSAAFESLGAPQINARGGNQLGLLVGLTECRDPEQLNDFHHWYDEVHAADVVKSPYYWRARRFQKIAGDLPNFLALYDSEVREPTAFESYLSWPERNPQMHPSAEVKHVWTFNLLEDL